MLNMWTSRFVVIRSVLGHAGSQGHSVARSKKCHVVHCVCLFVPQCLVMSPGGILQCGPLYLLVGILCGWFHQFMEHLDSHVLGCHFIEIFALVSYVNMLIKSVNSCEFSATQLIHELCIQSN